MIAIQSILKSQYHAALAMLRQMIEDCPDDLWVSRDYRNRYWHIAYHTLYFTHMYLQPRLEDFRPWEHHQTGIHNMEDVPPEEIIDLEELPHRPPQTGEPYTKAQLLEYWRMCDRMVDRCVDALDLESPTCGFDWYKIPKLEHQIVSIRHIQHHTAQLGERLRKVADIGLKWAGSRRV